MSVHFNKVSKNVLVLAFECMPFVFSQDREVLSLQAKIDEMTREREKLSKENDHIMNEVLHCY